MDNDKIKLEMACGQLKAAMSNRFAVEEHERTMGVYEHKGWTLRPSEASKKRVCKCGRCGYPMGIKRK